MTQVPITDELTERVNYLFHHTLLSDSQIAIKIAEEDGLQSSANQIQEIRLWPDEEYDSLRITDCYVRPKYSERAC